MPSLPSPTDNNLGSYPVHIDYSSLEPNEEIKFTPDYKANERIFLRVFKELANENNGSVSYYKLQERLISNGKFDSGGSVLMIEHMERTAKIEKTGDHNTYRIGKPPTKEEGLDYRP